MYQTLSQISHTNVSQRAVAFPRVEELLTDKRSPADLELVSNPCASQIYLDSKQAGIVRKAYVHLCCKQDVSSVKKAADAPAPADGILLLRQPNTVVHSQSRDRKALTVMLQVRRMQPKEVFF